MKGARVAVISYGLWQRTLGGVPDVLDRDLRIGGVPVRIVGVLPPDSMWPAEQQIWLPLRPAQFGENVLRALPIEPRVVRRIDRADPPFTTGC